MSSYEIKRWDPVLFGNSVSQVPMIYIEPDLAFKEFIQANANSVICEISGTGTIYDGKQIPGVVDNSCFVPNCRPNFCDQTGLYVITLWADWYEYPQPDKLGYVVFKGMKVSPAENPNSVPTINQDQRDISDSHGMKTRRILAVCGTLVLLLVLIWLVAKRKH